MQVASELPIAVNGPPVRYWDCLLQSILFNMVKFLTQMGLATLLEGAGYLFAQKLIKIFWILSMVC